MYMGLLRGPSRGVNCFRLTVRASGRIRKALLRIALAKLRNNLEVIEELIA